MNKRIDQIDISAENEGKSISKLNQYQIRKTLRKSKIKIAKRLGD